MGGGRVTIVSVHVSWDEHDKEKSMRRASPHGCVAYRATHRRHKLWHWAYGISMCHPFTQPCPPNWAPFLWTLKNRFKMTKGINMNIFKKKETKNKTNGKIYDVASWKVNPSVFGDQVNKRLVWWSQCLGMFRWQMIMVMNDNLMVHACERYLNNATGGISLAVRQSLLQRPCRHAHICFYASTRVLSRSRQPHAHTK